MNSNNRVKLPVFKIISEVLCRTKLSALPLLKASIPLLAAILILLVFTQNIYTPDSTLQWFLLAVVAGLIFSVLLVKAIVTIHRIFVLKTTTKLLSWRWRETRFVGYLTLTWLISMVLITILGALTIAIGVWAGDIMPVIFVGFLIAYFLIFYVAVRLAMVFPAVAVEDPKAGLLHSWKLSSGNGWRLFFIIILVPLVPSFIYASLPESDSIFYLFISGIMLLMTSVIGIGLISVSYEFLTHHANNNQQVDEQRVDEQSN